MRESLDLDHVAVVVTDLDRAEENYTRLGFQLTKRSSHKGPVPPDGTVGPWGSGNHCAMFERGYFELLGITDPDLFKAHIDRRLSRYEGLHLIAFGTGDCRNAVAECRASGAAISDPAMIGRDVPFGSGTRPGAFGIANLDPDVYPEADFIVIEQMTRDVLWQKSLMTHPNGVVSLEGITLCTADPGELIDRLTSVLGSPSGGTFTLNPGAVEILSVEETAAQYPGAELPAEPPCTVAVKMGVVNLAKCRAYFEQNRVPFEINARGHIQVGADLGCGAIIEFVEIASEDNQQ